ncbi:UCN3 protein, partial [Sitta europaea]|nr:UCN3 protein [Sitta europaea]
LLLLLLLLLLGPGRALSFSSAASLLSCLQAALWDAQHSHPQDTGGLGKRGSERPPLQEASQEDTEEEEELGKRTFPGDKHPKFLSQASPNRAKSDRRAKVTLSLDVPTNIMNILFNIAKAKNLRAKAAANAHLMAQIGRK